MLKDANQFGGNERKLPPIADERSIIYVFYGIPYSTGRCCIILNKRASWKASEKNWLGRSEPNQPLRWYHYATYEAIVFL